MGNQKILVFDSWTESHIHLKRLVEPFRQRGMDLLLLHIGSWGHDAGRSREEYIGPLQVRDISYYEGLRFPDILDREQPAAVVFLSLTAFAHRAFNRYCIERRIPTVHLYHGLVNVQPTALKRLNPVSGPRTISMALQRLPKNLTRLIPVYARSLWETGAALGEWTGIVQDLWGKVAGTSYSGVAPPDASADLCCVYTEADVPHAVTRYRATRDSVAVVGNPDLIAMGVNEADLGVCLSRNGQCGRDVVYIDCGLLSVGMVFDSEDEYLDHMTLTRDTLARHDLRLVVKLHPAQYQMEVPALLQARGIELCTNADFFSLLRSAYAAIAEPSSASIIPALLGLPVFMVRYGKLADQTYGDVLMTYPNGRELHAIEDLSTLAATLAASVHADDVRRWIDINAGPVPFAEMPHRVAEACQDLIVRHPDA